MSLRGYREGLPHVEQWGTGAGHCQRGIRQPKRSAMSWRHCSNWDSCTSAVVPNLCLRALRRTQDHQLRSSDHGWAPIYIGVAKGFTSTLRISMSPRRTHRAAPNRTGCHRWMTAQREFGFRTYLAFSSRRRRALHVAVPPAWGIVHRRAGT